MQTIYLDNNATTQPAPEVVEIVREAVDELWANPSSVHRPGQLVRQRLELARASIASLIGGKPRELLFTSGGTESNNFAIRGLLPEGKGLLVTSRVEHAAVRAPAEAHEQRGGEVAWLDVDAAGRVDPAEVERVLHDWMRQVVEAPHINAGPRAIVSVQWANNETGTIQPVEEVGERIAKLQEILPRTYKLFYHLDATQAVGKLPVEVTQVGADAMTFAGHKFHGMKGAGALWLRRGVRPEPLIVGGPQEQERRGGTENVTGVLAMGRAAELAAAFLADEPRIAELREMRDRFEAKILEALADTVVNSAGSARLWNTSNLGFPGIEAEAILLSLSERGVCASAGAACSSGSLEPSPVLLAMHLPEPVAHGSVRFSLSRYTTPTELDTAAEHVIEIIRRLQKTLPT